MLWSDGSAICIVKRAFSLQQEERAYAESLWQEQILEGRERQQDHIKSTHVCSHEEIVVCLPAVRFDRIVRARAGGLARRLDCPLLRLPFS